VTCSAANRQSKICNSGLSLPIADCCWTIEKAAWRMALKSIGNRQSQIGNIKGNLSNGEKQI
jgi:hypothetical protein